MELELGIKLARVADEFTSTGIQIAKDRAGPLFLSRETETLFILTAHLKGYKKTNIKIEINEDGTRIVISGEKAIQETVMVGWKLYKQETEIRGFRKAFNIPEGVILDKIKANFDEDESILTISMPKKEKGIWGFIVEEVKEQELARGGSETLQVSDDHEFPPEHILEEGVSREEEVKNSGKYDLAEGRSPKGPENGNGKEPKESIERIESEGIRAQNTHDMKEKDQPGQTGRPEKIPEEHEHETEMVEGRKYLPDEVSEGSKDPSLTSTAKAPVVESCISTDGIPQEERKKQGELEKETISLGIQMKMEEEEEEPSAVEKPPEEDQKHKPAGVEEKGRLKLCTPIVAGSALLLSLVVFVIQFIRTKSQPGKRKD